MRTWTIVEKVRRCGVLLTALSTTLLLGTAVAAPPAQSRTVTYDLDIPAQSLNDALQALALVSKHKLLYSSELVDGKRSPAVKGRFTTEQAVKALLFGSHLSFEVTSDGLVLIRAADPPPGTNTAAPITIGSTDRSNQIAQTNSTATVTNTPVTSANSGVPSRDSASVYSSSQRSDLNEIVVTAQKKTERLQDVPVPVTVISAGSLVDSDQLRIQDYYTRIPGLTINYDGIRGGLPTLTIRGIRASAAGNPTVGIVVDELSYGSSTAIGGGGWVPDIDPGDLERVEVLRGPQGTLYGASSMGGLLKFVTIDPSTESISGRVQVGVSSVQNDDGPGHSLRGSVNVPLSDTLAVRVSGFTRRDPGYIDDPTLGLDGVNRTEVDGGRLSALWQPSEDLSVKVGALIQNVAADGSPYVYPGLGDLRQSAARGTGWLNRQFQVYDATLKGKLGRVDLTAISGYSVNRMTDSVDLSPFYGTAVSIDENNKTKKYTQEVRLSLPIGRKLEWLFGAFYANEDSQLLQPTLALDTDSGARTGFLGSTASLTTFEELAAFTNATWNVTDRLDVQVGGRYAADRIAATQISTNATGIETPSNLGSNEDTFTYLVTPRFRVSPNLMTYMRLASGYRAGGVNLQSTLPANADLPRSYRPDKTQNYEVGIKADVLDHALSVDASLYYIDWQNIQLALVAPGRTAGFMDNGGRAKSQGVELSVESRPLPGLTIAAWGAWSDAVLTDNFPLTSTVRGFEGDRLPFSSPWSGNISIDQAFPLSSNVTGFAGAAVSYVGDRLGVFTGPGQGSPLPSNPRQDLPAYTKVDLRAGARYSSWTVDIFVNNVADKRGVLSGGLGNLFPTAFSYIQPRTAGLSLTKTF